VQVGFGTDVAEASPSSEKNNDPAIALPIIAMMEAAFPRVGFSVNGADQDIRFYMSRRKHPQ